MPSTVDKTHTKPTSVDTVLDRFEAIASRFPNLNAVVDEHQHLTYETLNKRSNALANKILEKISLDKKEVVAIVADRSVDCIVAILGVLKSGHAYVFFEPDHPVERINFILKDCSVPILVTDQKNYDNNQVSVITINEEQSEAVSYPVKRAIDDLLYVVYTSGSTGTPKGVKISHRNLMNYYQGILDKVNFDDCHSFAHLTTFSADLGNTILYVSLLKGGCLHILSQETVFVPEQFAKYIQTHKIDCYKSVPSHLKKMTDNLNHDFLPTKVLISGGERLSHDLVAKLYAADSGAMEIYNHYGPSETCIGVLTYKVSRGENRGASIPIGKPITNVRCYVLNETLKHVSVNMIGELFVAGDALSMGYINDEVLTTNKFLENVVPGEKRVYRTGDMVRILSTGHLEFIRRKDDQIKINGYRVELGEIEKVISKHPKIKEALVQYYRSNASGDMLTAFVKPEHPYTSSIVGADDYRLPNGLLVNHLNKNETDYIYHEIFELEAYHKHGLSLNKGDVVFDVGSNIGLFSLFAHTLERQLKLYAFEPNPDVYALLKRNLNRYDLDCNIFNMGLSSEAGQKDFSFYTHFSLLSGYYIDDQNEKNVIKNYVKNQNHNEHSDAAIIERDVNELLEDRFKQKKVISTKLETISSIIEKEGVEKIDLLKINVEKSELDVLQGIKPEDWSKIRQIVLEIDTQHNYDEIIVLLKSKSFQFYIEKDVLLKGTSLCYIFAFLPDFESRSSIKIKPDPPFYLQNRFDEQELKTYLADYLPYYMMPQKFVFLKDFPVTTNGKLDRNALFILFEKNNTVHVDPRNEREGLFTRLLLEVLKIETLSVTENLFIHGMDSIKAIVYVTKLSEHGFNFSIHDIFTYNTVEQLAARAEEFKSRKVPNSSQLIRQSFESFIEKMESYSKKTAYYPATFDHRMNWDLFQKHPNTSSRNSAFILLFEDENGLENLNKVLDYLIERHEALRTCFTMVENVLYQAIKSADAVERTVEDISMKAVTEQENLVRAIFVKERDRPFDLEAAPMFRSKIIKLKDSNIALICCSHHITMDGWSVDLLRKEILDCHQQLMTKSTIDLPPLKVQFKHYAAWKNYLFNTPSVNESEHAFWKSKLSGMKSITRLFHAPAEDSSRDSIESEGYLFYFDKEVETGLEKIAGEHRSSLYMALFSAAYLLLYKVSGRKDITIGMPHVNRNYKEWQGVIGEFAGPVPIRIQLNEKEHFSTLLKQVTKNIFEVINRPKYPSLFLKELIRIDADYQFSLLLGKQDVEENETEKILDFTTQYLASTANARFEMAMYPAVFSNGIEMTIKFQKRYYNRTIILEFIDRYKKIVAKIAAGKDFQINRI